MRRSGIIAVVFIVGFVSGYMRRRGSAAEFDSLVETRALLATHRQ